MSARRPRLVACDDAGMTLVEVMVAMMVLTVVFSAMASVLITSLHSLVGNESRVRANALANEVLEDLQAVSWDEVGFSRDEDHGYRDAVDMDAGEACALDDVGEQACEATVAFEDQGGEIPSGDRPLPLRDGAGGTELVERGGTEYRVRTDITWVDDEATGSATDYKRFRVTLSWDDLGRARSVTHSATRAPTSDEQAGAEFAIASVRVEPGLGYLCGLDDDDCDEGKLVRAVGFDDDGVATSEPVGRAAITVRTTEAAERVDVLFTDRETTAVEHSLAKVDGDDPTEWESSSSTASSWRYRNGDTTFTVVAKREGSDEEATTTKMVRYVYEDHDLVAMEVDGQHHDVDPDGVAPHVTASVCVDADGRVAQDVQSFLTAHGVTRGVDDRVEVDGPGFAEETEVSEVDAEERSTPHGTVFELLIEEGHDFSGSGDRVEIELTLVRDFDDRRQARTLGLDLVPPEKWEEDPKCDG